MKKIIGRSCRSPCPPPRLLLPSTPLRVSPIGHPPESSAITINPETGSADTCGEAPTSQTGAALIPAEAATLFGVLPRRYPRSFLTSSHPTSHASVEKHPENILRVDLAVAASAPPAPPAEAGERIGRSTCVIRVNISRTTQRGAALA